MTTTRPRVAVTMDRRQQGGQWYERIRTVYLEAVREAGGEPLAIPGGAGAQALAGCHALLLTGGGDFDPARYGKPDAGTRWESVCPARDATEIALILQARRRGMPVLGICRGMQALAVAGGGTLIQHLDGRGVAHEQKEARHLPTHPVRILPGSALAEIVGATAYRVNSFHHQAVERLPAGWRAVAWAPDGVIEAMEPIDLGACRPGVGWAIGVQWHPEDLTGTDAAARRLFEALVAAARRFEEGGGGGAGG